MQHRDAVDWFVQFDPYPNPTAFSSIRNQGLTANASLPIICLLSEWPFIWLRAITVEATEGTSSVATGSKDGAHRLNRGGGSGRRGMSEHGHHAGRATPAGPQRAARGRRVLAREDVDVDMMGQADDDEGDAGPETSWPSSPLQHPPPEGMLVSNGRPCNGILRDWPLKKELKMWTRAHGYSTKVLRANFSRRGIEMTIACDRARKQTPALGQQNPCWPEDRGDCGGDGGGWGSARQNRVSGDGSWPVVEEKATHVSRAGLSAALRAPGDRARLR